MDSQYFELLNASTDKKFNNLKEWFKYKESIEKNTSSFETAVVDGFKSTVLYMAFLNGYEAACSFISKKNLTSFCATEKTKGSPIDSTKTTIKKINENYSIIEGEKSFVTFGKFSKHLLVTVKDENEKLKCILIDSNVSGISFDEPQKKLNFLNEVPHSKIKFNNIKISNSCILEGDGYSDYYKKFRTIEDVHVIGSFLGYFLRVGRLSKWNEFLLIRILKLILSLNDLLQFDLLNPITHLLLNEILQEFGQIVEIILSLDFYNEEEKRLFLRDKNIFKVANAVRTKRTESAMNILKSKI
eukprot:gene4677-8249_t